MNKTTSLFDSNQPDEQRPWLREQVYEPRRIRTVELVHQSIDWLISHQRRVSLASITAQAKQLDPQGRGVSQSAILGNSEARAYYEAHRSWKGSPHRQSPQENRSTSSSMRPIKLDRNTKRTQQRYMQMSKKELVDRLVRVEQQYAEDRERWLQVNDELLMWRLRAEQAEQRCEKHQS